MGPGKASPALTSRGQPGYGRARNIPAWRLKNLIRRRPGLEEVRWKAGEKKAVVGSGFIQGEDHLLTRKVKKKKASPGQAKGGGTYTRGTSMQKRRGKESRLRGIVSTLTSAMKAGFDWERPTKGTKIDNVGGEKKSLRRPGAFSISVRR